MPPKSSLKQSFRKAYPKFKVYALITAVACLIFFIFIFLNSYFEVKTIRIHGDVRREKISGLKNLKGTNLYFLSNDSLAKTINKSNPTIMVEEITKEYPNILNIRVKQLEPIAQLRLNTGFAHLSETGKILKKIKQRVNQFPLINFYQQFDYYQLSIGNTLDYEELLTALLLLKKCQDLEVEIESIDISGLSMIVFNLKAPPDGEAVRKILLSAEKNKEKQANELETLLIQFKVKAQDFKVLDLRFDKPIVKF
ncbi:hypothetical protein A2954_03585 [Candidatus Roizmanbacteria bacterium RIFCSPLOWO2_01_FULL_37_12]|uniref:POTRA domain-containing protein n=1 Tax=Candidatus Roizmanbacteria bacterium RIFCSPLOWO2_01_FULL_37_12 TaxID=1802056 RepID=A0A1F7IEJ5_9BACT|nr:MAG: hypothetical protein A3D76_01995 [Candidatus Roizmanbacteria bacterium RIFCSPHIGHO2_02_FULL_37_9b]OGK41771.1 MAG: hypothetical protein A2954_03585 [Candidatus Roizmanbacteria bacterium RIFCSPLOWO2_01_FULL_37_12]